MPQVEGPLLDGVRTGKPWYASLVEPADFGYVEEEYLLSGTASDLGAAPQFAPYTTRMLVLRPADMREFNGTVLMDWTNVSAQVDAAVLWSLMHRYAAPRGYVFAAVSAQKLSVDGGPQAMKAWDPQRYGTLSHPGDAYSFDIFTQAARVLRSRPGPLPFFTPSAPRVEAVLAGGVSQGCSRLVRYIDLVDPATEVIDGILAARCRNVLGRRDAVPVLYVNSEYEAAAAVLPPDGDLVRVWEVAGASHLGWWGLSWAGLSVARDESNLGGATIVNPPWDPESTGQFGERGGGPCPQNFFPEHYVYDSALAGLDRWVRTGTPPRAAPRIGRDVNNVLLRDAHGNVEGGLRLPVMDVPVASYRSDVCPDGSVLMGMTVAFDPVTLLALYGDGSYLPKMQAASDAAVAKGYLVPEDAEDLMRRARASVVGAL